jgi:asparagine synthase (glutamine-hydrolysing)
MSGIVGILNLDGAPVDRALLRGMTDAMTFRGPDAQEIWVKGQVGFGHTLLRTTDESKHEHQPFTLDGRLWIVADARVDAQEELIAKLNAHGEKVRFGATDVELLLRAYRIWGERCVDHLLGDFSFAIWDGTQERLFCARDHFGIKPFYYASSEARVIFSNTLDCIRQHPVISDAVNEIAIGDFLLFGLNQNPATTFFAAIQTLPAGHCMTWADGEMHLRRYWSLPFDDPIFYMRSSDYVDHFRELLRMVVKDRLRTNRVGIYMSGGLDSTSAAATARDLLAEQFAWFDFRAHTVVYDWLIPDEERHYSGIAASALRIPIHYLRADDYELFERWDQSEQWRPEPNGNPLSAIEADQLRQIAAHSRVALYCEGPDNLLRWEWRPYVNHLMRGLKFNRLLMDVGRYIRSQRRLPFISGIPTRLRRLTTSETDFPFFPSWLNPTFAHRLALRDRFDQWQSRPPSSHPIRPKACASLELADWRYLFDSSDPGVTQSTVELRYPFMDVRMARYLMAVPPVPWCANKHLLRETMRGILPEQVRRRPKTCLAVDVVSERLRRNVQPQRRQCFSSKQLANYVDIDVLRLSLDSECGHVWKNWINLRPFAVNYWLRHVEIGKEKSDELRTSGIHQETI